MKIEDIKNVTVAGGGTQGSQIASQIAYKGFAVTVWVRSEASVERARVRFATIKKQYLSTLEAMKADAGLSSRCMPFAQEQLSDVCPVCGKPAQKMVVWGVAY